MRCSRAALVGGEGEERTVGREAVEVVKDPRQMRLDLVKALEDIIQVRLDQVQVPVDREQDARSVALELGRAGDDGRSVGG